jgi:hypothetical protein
MIFIGIMFTAVIPMMLVMRQADTIYEMRKHELASLDQERAREDLYLYVYPETPTLPVLIVKVQNRGELAIRVVRLWVNDDPTELDVAVPPMSGVVDLKIISLVSPPPGSSYFITATTDRGNVVAFDTPLTWQGYWQTDVLSVNVLICSLPGQEFKIEVQGSDYLGDSLTEKFDPKFFIVPSAGTYTVTIYRGSKPIYVKEVTITWPEGSPVEWVFA